MSHLTLIILCFAITTLDGKNVLKEHLVERKDYRLLSEQAWIKLLSWYGLAEGSFPIPRYNKVSSLLMLIPSYCRRVIEYGQRKTHYMVEVYQLELILTQYPTDRSASVPEQFSGGDTTGM